MSSCIKILAIDAASQFGFAYGSPGEMPMSGAGRFASNGASHGALFHGAFRWTVKAIERIEPTIVLIEQPVDMHGRTNAKVTRVLNGIPAVVEAAAYSLGLYQTNMVEVARVRCFFLETKKRNIKGSVAKPQVLEKCKRLGWTSGALFDSDLGDPKFQSSFDRTDALAIWAYGAAMLTGDQAMVGPLFAQRDAA